MDDVIVIRYAVVLHPIRNFERVALESIVLQTLVADLFLNNLISHQKETLS